jgi:hypothetical protein
MIFDDIIFRPRLFVAKHPSTKPSAQYTNLSAALTLARDEYTDARSSGPPAQRPAPAAAEWLAECAHAAQRACARGACHGSTRNPATRRPSQPPSSLSTEPLNPEP